jgi:hypothetical protein
MVGALAPSADPGPANACDGAKRSVPHVREGGAAYPLVRKPSEFADTFSKGAAAVSMSLLPAADHFSALPAVGIFFA